jgi:hypothetical protein
VRLDTGPGKEQEGRDEGERDGTCLPKFVDHFRNQSDGLAAELAASSSSSKQCVGRKELAAGTHANANKMALVRGGGAECQWAAV